MTEEMNSKLEEMDLAGLDDLIARASELRQKRHAERMQKLQDEAHALGAVVKVNGKGPRRGRKPKHHDE